VFLFYFNEEIKACNTASSSIHNLLTECTLTTYAKQVTLFAVGLLAIQCATSLLPGKQWCCPLCSVQFFSVQY